MSHPPGEPGALVAAFRSAIGTEPGTDVRLVEHLQREYGGVVEAIATLDAAVYGVDWSDGRRWIARVFPPARSVSTVEGDAGVLRVLSLPARTSPNTSSILWASF